MDPGQGRQARNRVVVRARLNCHINSHNGQVLLLLDNPSRLPALLHTYILRTDALLVKYIPRGTMQPCHATALYDY